MILPSRTKLVALDDVLPCSHVSSLQYKIELRIRNHSTLARMEIIQEVARCMPESYMVDLDNPDVFILVEVFKV